MIFTWEMQHYNSWVTSSSSKVKFSLKSVWFLWVSAWHVRLLSGESREVWHKKKVRVTSESITKETTIANISGMAMLTWSIYQCRLPVKGKCGVGYVLLYMKHLLFENLKRYLMLQVFWEIKHFSRCREPCFNWVKWKEQPPWAEHMKSALSNDHVLALLKTHFSSKVRCLCEFFHEQWWCYDWGLGLSRPSTYWLWLQDKVSCASLVMDI